MESKHRLGAVEASSRAALQPASACAVASARRACVALAERWRTLPLAAVLLVTTSALAAPVTDSWPADGPGEVNAVAAAAVSGWFATADTTDDRIEIRDVQGTMMASIARSRISALLPWMSLSAASGDGPTSLAFSDSGRLLFFTVQDAAPSGDAQPDDAVLRYDVQQDDLTVFARLAFANTDTPTDVPSLAHFAGRLHVGANGALFTYRAQRGDRVGTLLSTSIGQAGQMITGLTVDREQAQLLAAWNGQVFRTPAGNGPLNFTSVGAVPGVRALSFSSHFGTLGGTGNGGATGGALFALARTVTPGTTTIVQIPATQSRGQLAFAPTTYFSTAEELRDLTATADGRLLAATALPRSDAMIIRDNADTRLNFTAWTNDEFAQVVRLAKGLIAPDGEPAGWVIDADVQQGGTRFHPATPDGAAWTILVLIMNDHLRESSGGDPQARTLVRTILQRYAGRAADGIAPTRSADGIFRHWINPLNGGVKPGWPAEFATMSTMKIVLAASRAAVFYPDDAEIRASARAIVCNVRNWPAYFSPVNARMYLAALAGGGADLTTPSGPYHEGLIFAEQATNYGGPAAAYVLPRWLDRATLPSATFIAGRPITGDVSGQFQPAFISLYSLLTQRVFRDSPAWREQIRNMRMSFAAWTDDDGSRYFTVFSAGTTKGEWGGYHADSLSDRPGDVTTFPSLLAFAAGTGADTGPDARSTAEAVAAYHAYRNGARQTFRTGASFLYRRSDVDRLYTPDSAGLPDVALGALGLAELLRPGSVRTVLTGPLFSCVCPADFNGDGAADFFDYLDFVAAFDAELPSADFNRDTAVDFFDYLDFVAAFDLGCG
jgi:hypothetical protein